jgi:uncharacterized lipoprotein YajG
MLALVAACLLLAGCERRAAPDGAIDITGTYTLISINGNSLPFTPPHEGGAPGVQSGSFTINADGTCSSKVTFVVPSGAQATREVTATYTQDGATLHMQWKGAGTTIGTIEGNTFTMNNEGLLFAYRK